jgi:hypothetical protein
MTRFISYSIKTIVITVIVVLMIQFTGAIAGAEQLEDKALTIAPLWYQLHVLASIDEAANTINNFKPLFSDWAGGEIQQLSVDHSGVRFVAVITWSNTNTQWVPTYGGYFIGSTYVPYSSGYYQTTQTPQSSETRISIPANDITNVKLLHFPYLQRDNKWGVDIRFSNGANITLRTKTLDTAQKIADSLATLAVANGCKLPSPFGLICQTENTTAEYTRLYWTTGKGALVNSVFPGSPADQAGLMRDDIIAEVNSQTITDPNALASLVNKSLENRSEVTLELKVFRDGQIITKPLSIKNLYYGNSIISSTLKPLATGNVVPQSLGISARNLTAEELQKAGFSEQVGIFITSIDPGSLAEQMGMKPGDYLLEINNQKVANVGLVKQFLASGAVIQDLKIWRNGAVMVLNGVNKL